jgi:hypothetical protein
MRLRCLLVATVLAVCVIPASSAHAADPTPNWTLTTPNDWNRTSSPVIADINGDGKPEIVVGHEDGYVRALEANGSSLGGWPQPALMGSSSPTAIDSSPTVADLNKDGKREVIVGVGSNFQANHNGGVIVYRGDGSVQCRFFTRDTFNVATGNPGADGYSDGVFSTPAIGDVNGDGKPDIVFGSWDHYVHAIDRTCHELPGFPVFVDDTIWSSPSLYDIDHDGRLEIFIGNDQTAGGPDNWQGGELRALDWQNGVVRELWKRQVSDVIQSSPAIADINGDGHPDVIVGAGDAFNSPDGHRVWAFDAVTGANLRGWPVLTGGVTFSSPALGDLDGDGRPDVAIGSSDGVLQVYKGNGGRLWAVHLPFNTGPGGAITASPIIADMNGDGHNDVGVGNNWGFFIVNGRTGAIISKVNTFKSYGASGAVGDFGSAGWRLVVTGFDTPHHSTTMASYSIPRPLVTPPWPVFHRTAAHIGAPASGGNPLPPNQCRASSNPAPHESAASGAGYWFVDSKGAIYSFGDAKFKGGLPGLGPTGGAAALTASPGTDGYWILSPSGGVFSFGGAAFHGSMGGRHLNAPIIAMTPTTTGKGYWLLAADGGVFSFGDASFFGSTGGIHLNKAVISMAAGPGGVGYWLLASDGGVFSFHVPFYGSVPGAGLCSTPVSRQIRSSSTGHGYWLLATNGLVFHFGDARYFGSYTRVTSPAIDIAILR